MGSHAASIGFLNSLLTSTPLPLICFLFHAFFFFGLFASKKKKVKLFLK